MVGCCLVLLATAGIVVGTVMSGADDPPADWVPLIAAGNFLYAPRCGALQLIPASHLFPSLSLYSQFLCCPPVHDCLTSFPYALCLLPAQPPTTSEPSDASLMASVGNGCEPV